MKVSELTGAQLDYWVARAEGYEIRQDGEDCPHWIQYEGKVRFFDQEPYYSPSRDWSIGGPIIERERIVLVPPRFWNQPPLWLAIIDEDFETTHGLHPVEEDGPTPLVAAMRAFVASKFGEEVPA